MGIILVEKNLEMEVYIDINSKMLYYNYTYKKEYYWV